MLDLVLAFYLILVLPGQQLWRSFHKPAGPPKSRPQRYLKTIATILALLAVLALASYQAGRGTSDLGLALPPPEAGLWGLAAATVLLAGLQLSAAMSSSKNDPQKRAAYLEKLKAIEGMPRSGSDLAIFVFMALLVGLGWEVLYRGFLLPVLTPSVGAVGAIVLSSLAYGLGHGYAGPKALAGSLAAAVLFTCAYYFTGSLWWLIVIHDGLPLLGGIKAYNTYKAPVEAVPDSA